MNAICLAVVAPMGLVCGLSVSAVILLLLTKKHLRGTTLIAPWWWSVVSFLCIGAGDLVAASGEASLAIVRYCAAVTTVCPVMALLGAKRPQDRGWQFVVLSLWIVLVLPAAQTLILWRGGRFELSGFWSWFLLTLVLVGLLNHLLTRNWLSALCFGSGQVLLLGDHLPLVSNTRGPLSVVAGLVFMQLAVVAAIVVARLGRRRVRGADAVWLDFRDAYGLVWALRIMDRINSTSATCEWNLRLGWQGFQTTGNRLSPTVEAELNRTLRTLLRRFVSTEWIDSRLPVSNADG